MLLVFTVSRTGAVSMACEPYDSAPTKSSSSSLQGCGLTQVVLVLYSDHKTIAVLIIRCTTRELHFGNCLVKFKGSRPWNNLLDSVKTLNSIPAFKIVLKIIY